MLLIDFDLQFGQVATHLNLTPRYDLAALATDDPSLADPELARTYLTTHSSGLNVLAAPARPEADFRVSLEHLQRIIELMQPSFDHILVDLGSRLDPRSVWLLEQSDAHVFVLFPEIAALRAMSLLMTFLAETTPLRARTHIVINHVFPKELLKTRDVENLLRTKPTAEVPYTEVEMIRSVNEGVPLVSSRPTLPAAIAMRRVAQAVIGIEQPQVAAKRAAAPDVRPPLEDWCRRRDSNPHALRPPGLSRLRLPFRHSGAAASVRHGADDWTSRRPRGLRLRDRSLPGQDEASSSQTGVFDNVGSLHWIPSSSRAVLGLTSASITVCAPAIQSSTDSHDSTVGWSSAWKSPRSESEATSMSASGANASSHAGDASPITGVDAVADPMGAEPSGASLSPPPDVVHAASRAARVSPMRILFMPMQSPVFAVSYMEVPRLGARGSLAPTRTLPRLS